MLEKVPKHLMNLVIDQPYHDYTAQDHALWRYVMRQNVRYLSGVAHGSYLDGLKRTGISLEKIPVMYGMNRILKEIGWAAVAVDGFIPPSAFMEFQAYNVLVIAADIRPIDQIGYTSAPDIIHEAAGHAPIIADPAYANYLTRFGEIGAKAFSSVYDNQMYEAIRHLSILKADPYSDRKKVEEAEQVIDSLEESHGEPSELAQIRNLHWWTVEYGLIGDLEHPKIYGAGLLSSIAESYYCMQPRVKKIPYSIDAVDFSFDITEPQPQLFVTPNFEELMNVLEEYANSMALRKGGVEGIMKAIRSETIATCVLSSGVQISGTFTEVISNEGKPVFFRTTGLTNLNYAGKEVAGQDKEYHKHGFSSPIGRIKTLSVPPEEATDKQLEEAGFIEQEKVEFEFESGIKVRGILKEKVRRDGKLIILKFSECEIKFRGKILYEPSWGIFDLAIGSEVISCFAGPADPVSYGLSFEVPKEKTHKLHHTEKAKELFRLYQRVRETRENNNLFPDLKRVWDDLKVNHPDDWLCALEILELYQTQKDDVIFKDVYQYLDSRKAESENLKKLINDGFAVLQV